MLIFKLVFEFLEPPWICVYSLLFVLFFLQVVMSPYVPVVWFGWLWWLELCTHKILFKNNVNPSMLLSSPKKIYFCFHQELLAILNHLNAISISKTERMCQVPFESYHFGLILIPKIHPFGVPAQSQGIH